MFFIWVLQLTALFHQAIWLCVYKREVRGGHEILGIKQADKPAVRLCVCVCKIPPLGAKKAVCMTHAHVEGYHRETG